MRQAWLYDDPGGGPERVFTAARHGLLPPERDRILQFVTGGRVVLATTGRTKDKLDPSRGEVVPLSMATDGE